jgi:hypothetical protein
MGFYTTSANNPITSATVTVQEGGSAGFAVGQFGISQGEAAAPDATGTGGNAEVATQVEAPAPIVAPEETTAPAPTETAPAEPVPDIVLDPSQVRPAA